MLNPHLIIIHRDQRASLGTNLSNMATLRTAWVNNPWITTNNLSLMDVAQRPVVVAFCSKLINIAGGVVGVPLPAIETRMQHPNVEPVWVTLWEMNSEIFTHSWG